MQDRTESKGIHVRDKSYFWNLFSVCYDVDEDGNEYNYVFDCNTSSLWIIFTTGIALGAFLMFCSAIGAKLYRQYSSESRVVEMQDVEDEEDSYVEDRYIHESTTNGWYKNTVNVLSSEDYKKVKALSDSLAKESKVTHYRPIDIYYDLQNEEAEKAKKRDREFMKQGITYLTEDDRYKWVEKSEDKPIPTQEIKIDFSKLNYNSYTNRIKRRLLFRR